MCAQWADYVFRSGWTFWGTVVLIIVVSMSLTNVINAIRGKK